jgi:hypothetical protein
MKRHMTQICAVALLLGTAALAHSAITLTGGPGSDSYAQSKGITITGGPGSDNTTPLGVGLSPTGPGGPYSSADNAMTSALYNAISEERTLQLVRQTMAQDAVQLGLVPPPGAPLYNGVQVNPNPQIAKNPGSVDTTGILTPSGTAITGSGSLGSTGPGRLIGVASGGSGALGVATPSGTFSPATSIAGTPGTGVTGR